MISWFRTHLRHMGLGDFLPLVLFMACISIALAFVAFLNANPDQNFWFVPALPVPPYARHVQHYSGSLPGSRTIRFETDQPAERIRQFYRVELPKHGWYYVCSATQLEQPECPLVLSLNGELADAYTREHAPLQVRAVNIIVYKPGKYLAGIEDRVVEVTEYRYSPPTAVPTATVGNATAGGRIILGFGDHSPVQDLPLWLGKESRGQPVALTDAIGEFTLKDLPIGQVVDVADDHLAF